ncbi:hypothetical protein LN650_11080 [Klebsiella pneumoniae subsp. pneumoniae]|nr:hypothetical protein [Klebsiella pneumoniae subsp. pneumoniae]
MPELKRRSGYRPPDYQHGKSLHMRIVAEGVETEEQLASLYRRWAVTWFRDI